MRMHDGSMGAPVAQLGGPGEPTLGGAGSGLSLSDGDASASVLSSLGEASDFDADAEIDADAPELHVPGSVSPEAAPAEMTHSPSLRASRSGKPRIPSSPFQQEHQPSSHQQQLVPGMPTEGQCSSRAEASIKPDEAPAQVPSGQPAQHTAPSGSEPSHQGRDGKAIQAASSDLMEAWSEQEQASEKGKAAAQLHERLSLGQSELTLDDLEELEQASSILDSMVEEAAELALPQQMDSAMPHRHGSARYSQPSSSLAGDDAAGPRTSGGSESNVSHQHEQHNEAYKLKRISEMAAQSNLEQHHPAERMCDASDSAAAAQSDRMLSEGEDSAAAEPVTSSEVSLGQEPETGSRPADNFIESRPASAEATLRPADDAFREGIIASILHKQAKPDTQEDSASQIGAQPEVASEPCSGASAHHPSSTQQRPEQNGVIEISAHSKLPAGAEIHHEHSEGRHSAEPDAAQTPQGIPQSSSEPAESAQRDDALEGLEAGSRLPIDVTAAPDEGSDKLAYAEALERALATGNNLVSGCCC